MTDPTTCIHGACEDQKHLTEAFVAAREQGKKDILNELGELEQQKLKLKYSAWDLWFVAIMSGLLGGCCVWMVVSF